MSLYDPREGFNVVSNNPILILADIMIKKGFADKSDSKFWDNITILANHADKINGNGNGNGRKPKRKKITTKIKKQLTEKKTIRKKKLDAKKALVRQKVLST